MVLAIVPPQRDQRLYCDACEHPRPSAGFTRYGRYQVCSSCAMEYERACLFGLVGSAGQFVRGRQFGEQLDLMLDLDRASAPSRSAAGPG